SRCPTHKPPGRYPGCRRGGGAGPRSSARAVRTGNLPRGPRRLAPDNEPTTRTPWSAAPSESWPDRRWSGLRNSGIPLAGASPHDRHLPALPPCSIGSTGDRSGDATATGEEAWLLLLREVCHTGADYVPLIMRGCIAEHSTLRLQPKNCPGAHGRPSLYLCYSRFNLSEC